MKVDQNTVVLVTGGSQGLGESTVRKFLALGAKVMIADLQEKGKEIEQEFGSDRCRFFKTNVTDEDNVRLCVEETVKFFGALHIVFNCAGVIHVGLFLNSKGNTIKTSDLVKVLQINVVGTFIVSKYAALQMQKQEPLNETGERGVIINVSSVAGSEGQKGQTVYAASKGAINGMTLPLARDLGKFGIRVVTVAPGIFMTPMGGSLSPKIITALERATALNKLGTPDQLADFVATACLNSYQTGQILRLDGGVKLPNM